MDKLLISTLRLSVEHSLHLILQNFTVNRYFHAACKTHSNYNFLMLAMKFHRQHCLVNKYIGRNHETTDHSRTVITRGNSYHELQCYKHTWSIALFPARLQTSVGAICTCKQNSKQCQIDREINPPP